ncbi:MAG: alanine racemase [Saprospiraceae bacterium]|nr:alanine racemase [Saprospiraceae bacterium]
MKQLTLKEIAEIIGGKVVGDENRLFTKLFTDSRVFASSTATFLALVGQRFNAHDFIPDLIEKGVNSFIVSQLPNTVSEASYLLVKDTEIALQTLAKWHREQFSYPVIGITGSNGKTIIKEWLSQLLSQERSVVKSPKSYNSQIGVPLSVLQMQPYHDIGIFEAGISQRGEMTRLEEIIQPTIGIFTNLGAAHDEGFSSREEKLSEKLVLFQNASVVIARKGHLPASEQLVEWEFTGSNSFKCGEVEFDFVPPFTSEAYLENLGHCLAAMAYLGYAPEAITQSIQELQSLDMRLEVKPGQNNSTLINDSYNADFNALEIALEHGRMQNAQLPLTLIVSDIPQTGLSHADMVASIEAIAAQKGVSRLITIGPKTHQLRNQDAYPTTDAFLATLSLKEFGDQVIVLKGARSFEFERISQRLEEKIHETVWEINLSALINNLNVYRSLLKPSVKVMAMVKALAYGAGDKEIAHVLQHQNVDYLGVAFVEEGVALREAGIKLPILVLNVAPLAFGKLIEYDLEPEVYSLEHLRRLITFLTRKNISDYPIHIKLDTGMHRLGFAQADLPDLLELLPSPQIKVKAVMSHLAASETPEEEAFTQQQIHRFEEMTDAIASRLNEQPLKHILNSAGIINFPDAQYDMVRLGIGLYGIDTSSQVSHQLQQIGTLKSHVSQVKTLQPGDTVGYGRAFNATSEMKMATIPIGYADGYDRRFSKGLGQVIIQGQQVPIIGNVCMDMLMVDVSKLSTVLPGEEVIITSPKLPLETLARKINAIPYELLTNISPRIKRLFVYE